MILLCLLLSGFVEPSDAARGQILAVPENVIIGETLTITGRILNSSEPNTHFRLFLQHPGVQTISIFHYRAGLENCTFVLEPYISTGTVIECDPANSRYVVKFQPVTEAHAGMYKMHAWNSHRDYIIWTDEVQVDVVAQFPPDGLSASSTIIVDEDQSVTVSCETTSKPKTKLEWTGPAVGQSIETTTLGPRGGEKTVQTVTLTGDRTRNGANYTCTAIYRGKVIHTTTTKFVVNFAPDAIVFHDTLDTPIPEHQERVMRCRAATSKPVGTIVWKKLQRNSKESVEISANPPTREVPGQFGGKILETEIAIRPTKRDDGAKYWCELEYAYANGTKVVRMSAAKVLDVRNHVDYMASVFVLLLLVLVGVGIIVIGRFAA